MGTLYMIIDNTRRKWWRAVALWLSLAVSCIVIEITIAYAAELSSDPKQIVNPLYVLAIISTILFFLSTALLGKLVISIEARFEKGDKRMADIEKTIIDNKSALDKLSGAHDERKRKGEC
jgi:putative effector of murein hydrolase LrgA (UPF0299 family)